MSTVFKAQGQDYQGAKSAGTADLNLEIFGDSVFEGAANTSQNGDIEPIRSITGKFQDVTVNNITGSGIVFVSDASAPDGYRYVSGTFLFTSDDHSKGVGFFSFYDDNTSIRYTVPYSKLSQG